jgi:hypothetical protein
MMMRRMMMKTHQTLSELDDPHATLGLSHLRTMLVPPPLSVADKCDHVLAAYMANHFSAGRTRIHYHRRLQMHLMNLFVLRALVVLEFAPRTMKMRHHPKTHGTATRMSQTSQTKSWTTLVTRKSRAKKSFMKTWSRRA